MNGTELKVRLRVAPLGESVTVDLGWGTYTDHITVHTIDDAEGIAASFLQAAQCLREFAAAAARRAADE